MASWWPVMLASSSCTKCAAAVVNRQDCLVSSARAATEHSSAECADSPAHPELLPALLLLLLRDAERLLNASQLPCNVLLCVGVHLVLWPATVLDVKSGTVKFGMNDGLSFACHNVASAWSPGLQISVC